MRLSLSLSLPSSASSSSDPPLELLNAAVQNSRLRLQRCQ